MAVRSWRTAFLTLRDETLVSPTPSSLNTLLQNLLFSQTDVLNAAAPDLPPHEVTSDVILLVELVKAAFEAEDAVDTFVHTCALIHDVSCHVCLEINSSSWAIMLEFLEKMLRCFLPKAVLKIGLLANATRMKLVMEILEIIRHLVNAYGRKCTLQESTQLVKLLIHIVACCNAELFQSAYSSGNQWGNAGETGSKMLKCQNLWEFQTIAFVMIGELLSRFGPSISVQIWQSTLEVLRKVMDSLVSKSLLVENSAMSRFYTSVLHCLHLVLTDPKGSLSDHVAGLVAALRMFFVYGITNRSPVCPDIRHIENGYSSIGHKSTFAEPRKSERGPYRPPHLREKEATKSPFRASDTRSSPDNELSALGFTSSDSEHSDNDGLGKDVDYFRSSKTRIAAIVCIQDLCQADPKAFTAHWTAILPTNNVLQPRKYEANLMTCLMFDPVLKARISSASTLAAMMGGPSSVSLQVAEYKESTRCGSYTALSSALGQILMQLHTGILYLVQHEAHNGLLASLFKILMLLISATPYARMPGELLSSVILSLSSRMIEGFPSRTDQIGLLAISLSCLGAAFSTSPPSLQVKELLQEEMSTGGQGKQSVLSLIFQLSERVANPTISFEALQVLRAVSHNYPSIMGSCWEKTSTLVYGLLRVAGPRLPGPESSARISKGDVGSSAGSLGERCIMAAVKVLDECLRAISGFKGTEDLKEDVLLETPFTSDCTRTKRISSAPSYGLDILEVSKGNLAIGTPGNKEWSEAIEKHLPLVISHGSAMVRAASVTCYAGITSSVFFSLMKEHQDFILSSTISAALKDEIPSVRSAACRAIGVIACFPQIAQRAEILDKFINAAEINSHDPVVSVRITASWALANICDLARHRSSELDSDMCSTDLMTDSRRVAILVECALRSSKDGDKIKSNAVRALGNLSRFVRFGNLSTIHKEHDRGDTSVSTYSIRHSSHTSTNVSGLASLGDPKWLERMVQAFVSCVTTGNVKVQWNVCHALSNLFLNETLKLHDMAWAPSVFSILLLLLRDSSNYKIRIHAAAALAVPCSKLDYGSSFSDVVQGLEQVLENLDSDQISTALNIKYIDALEKQLTASNLHVLSLVPCGDNVPLNDFLVKKASFLEEWLNSLCSSIAAASYQPEEESALPENQVDQSQATIQKKADASYQPEEESPPAENQVDQSQATIQKKEMIYKTIKALIEVYRRSNHQRIAERFEKLIVSGS